MEIDNKRKIKLMKEIGKTENDIAALQKKKDGMFVSENKKKEIQEKIEDKEYYLDLLQRFINGEDTSELVSEYHASNSLFTKVGKDLGKTSKALDKAGRATAKVGLHATGIVWTPVLYGGYTVGKALLSKDKKDSVNNNDITPEQEFIGLINECEQAFKEGKIDEDTMKFYIRDFANTKYRE